MPVDFKQIEKGSSWTRIKLAKLWGYASFHAIARGVFTPAKSRYIVLFVTENKQTDFVQYEDRLEGQTLFWEGEDRHGSDNRIASAADNGDEIHIFYRERHHQPFEYLGRYKVVSVQRHENTPSKFEFRQIS